MTKREVLQARLRSYLKAEHDVLEHGQTVEIEGMRITRASLEDLRKEIANLKSELAELDRLAKKKGRRIRAVVPLG